MSHPPNPAGSRPNPDQSMMIVVGAMAGSLVLLGVVLALLGAELAAPQAWTLLAVLVATVGAWAMTALGPVPRSAGGGAPALQALVLIRAAVLEAPALLGLALAFLSQPPNLMVYLLPALFALGGMWLFARPGVVRARLAKDHHTVGARPGR